MNRWITLHESGSKPTIFIQFPVFIPIGNPRRKSLLGFSWDRILLITNSSHKSWITLIVLLILFNPLTYHLYYMNNDKMKL